MVDVFLTVAICRYDLRFFGSICHCAMFALCRLPVGVKTENLHPGSSLCADY